MGSSIADMVLLEFSQNMASSDSQNYFEYSTAFDMAPRNKLSRYHHESSISPRAAYQASSPSYRTTTFATQTHAKRRSVDSMKELLPLSLPSSSPSPPSTPTFGPVSTRSSRQIAPVARRIIPRDQTSIPWLHAGLDSYAFDDLAPNKFRETPIYTEPDSPDLSRAYFDHDDEELSRTVLDYCRFAEAEESYFDSDSESECESESEFSETTAATSPSIMARFSGSSDLSFKCKGIKSSSQCQLSTQISEESLQEAFKKTNYHYDPKNDIESDDWMESDSSRSSSPDSFAEVHEAVCTPLTPARPQIVGVKTAERPAFIPPRMSSRPTRDLTAHRRLTCYNTSLPILDPIPPIPQVQEQKTRPTLSKSATMPNITPDIGTPRNKSASRYPLPTEKISSEVLTLPLVEAICDSISGSPGDLQLDTYCIHKIRRLNRVANNASVPSSTSRKITTSASTSNLGLRTRSKSIFSLRGLPKRADTPPPAYLQKRTRRLDDEVNNKPDLTPLKSIFPETADDCLEILYAHLLAYNYIEHLSTKPYNSTPKILPKLNLPLSPTLPDFGFQGYGNFMQEAWEMQNASGDEVEDGGFVAILRGLALRVQGVLQAGAGFEIERCRVGEGDVIDWAVIRTLAEVVRGCERVV